MLVLNKAYDDDDDTQTLLTGHLYITKFGAYFFGMVYRRRGQQSMQFASSSF